MKSVEGIGPILAIVFTILRLFGAISWPWVWVLSPLWIPWALIFAIGAIGGGVVFTTLVLSQMIDDIFGDEKPS